MLVNIAEKFDLPAAQPEVWRLLRDTNRLASLVPGVENVTAIESADCEAYQAKVTEKVGPFKVTLNLEIQMTELLEPAMLKATVRGADSHRLSHATGSVQVALSLAGAGTEMQFEAAVEVLGKLATLGATVIRRKVTELFAEFARRVREQFPAVQVP